MAERLLKKKQRKVAPKKAQVEETGRAACPHAAVLVGTYKEKQLSWIKRHGIYNYPVKDGDEFDEKAFASIKELWLYADVKGTRHVFEAEFVGVKTREELVDEYGYPANGVFGRVERVDRVDGRGKRPACPKSHGSSYYVFKTKYLDYGSRLDDPVVIARTADFGGRSAKVKKAIEQFKADGEFAPLEHYLPSDLAKVPRNRLRVCEAAVQLNFIAALFSPDKLVVTPREEFSKSYNVISMFSGAMGLDNGIEKAGMSIRLCVEIQHAMAETIRINRPCIPLIEDDVRNYSGADLKALAGLGNHDEVFLVCGGPPCQAFSTAGKRLGFDDDRGNVFLKYLDLIGEIKPKYFLLENVRGLLSAIYTPPIEVPLKIVGKGSALAYALKKIHDIGYSATFTLYDSANYGVPQNRERVIILGSRDGYKIPLIPPTHSKNGENGLPKWTTFRSATQGLKKCTAAPIPPKRLMYFKMLGPGCNWRNLPPEMQEKAMGKSFSLPGGKTGFYRRLAWDEPSPTLVTCPTMPATDLMHPVEDRALSIEEYARIQMFPDSWVFSGTMSDIYKQIGNAVPVGMGYAAARHLLWFDSLSEEQKRNVQLVDPNAVYSRYRNTSFEYFESKMN